MAYNDKLYLNLNDFESHIQTTWENLQTDEDFCDVTLLCNDKQMRSHKFVLSSYSPILHNMLKNSNQNAMIFFSGVQYADLANILNFIYQGEVNVSREDVNSFLTVANDLKIKGLFLEEESVKISLNLNEQKYRGKLIQENISDIKRNIITRNIDKFSQNCHDDKLQQISPLQNSCHLRRMGLSDVFQTSAINSDNSENVYENEEKYNMKSPEENILDSNSDIITPNIEHHHDEKIQQTSPLQRSDDKNITGINNILQTSALNINNDIPDIKNVYKSISKSINERNNIAEDNFCNVVEEKYDKKVQQISSLQLQNRDVNKIMRQSKIIQSDNLNNFIDTTKNKNEDNLKGIDLIPNEKNEQGNNFYSCDKCNTNFITNDALISHMQSIQHHKIYHPCPHCEYKTASDLRLTKHLKYKHYCDQCDFKSNNSKTLYNHKDKNHKERFKCDQCSYEAKEKGRLRDHIEALHGNSQHVCDECGYKTTTNRNLLRHKKQNHTGIFYFCDQCNYKTMKTQMLKRHINVEHKGVRFPCNQCEFKSKQMANLKRHIDSMHYNIKRKR